MSESPETLNLMRTVRPEWIMQLLKDSEYEETTSLGLKLLKPKTRGVLWNMASKFGYDKRGEAGQACRILERYIYHTLHSHGQICCYPDLSRAGALLALDAEKRAILENMNGRIMLLIACSIQLAVKMSSVEAKLSPKVIRLMLSCKGFTHSLQEIIQAEAEVFTRIGYRVPLWTSVEVAEQLAAQLDLSSEMVGAISIIMDLTEIKRNHIENKIFWTATGSYNTNGSVRTLHLCAGAVAAAVKFYDIPTETMDARACLVELAYFVDAPASYLSCIANIIITKFLADDSSKKIPIL